MENDIPLQTFGATGGETTCLLQNCANRYRINNTKKQFFTYKVTFLIIIFTSSVFIALFTMSANNRRRSYVTASNNQSTQPLRSIVKSRCQLNLKNGEYYALCAPKVACDSSAKYRTMNGTCNNPNSATWGSSYTPFVRLSDAYYSDGISKLRLSSNGLALPSARKIQVELFLNRQINVADRNNQLLMQWAQFVAHDVSNLAVDKNGEDCCLNGNGRSAPRACAIDIPDNDPVYSYYNKTCMRFTRAMTSANYSCALKPSTFINDASHFIDGSQVYGSNDYIASTLRSFSNGMLKSVVEENQEFCPHSSFQSSDTNAFFYNSGDARANTNLGIALFHNMFLRFHNFVALRLKTANSEWSDETLYQESRKIVAAIIQHITYTDFLPIILGKNYTREEVLAGDKYDPTVIPSTSQEFSTGAFRALHNLIPTRYEFIDSNYAVVQTVNVTDWMNRPYLLQQGSNFDNLLRGLINTGGRLSQPSYNFMISNFMFHPNNSAIGLDLLSYDIQRGRDTGLPPYNKMRELCGLPVAKSFDDLADVISSDDIYELENLYHSVDDIDFLVGALLETPEEDALVGNTSRCIIGDFFYRSRVGDRFFYSNNEQTGQFTEGQLGVLKSIGLYHIICASSSVDHLQKNIFTKVDNRWFSSMKWTCNEKYQIDFEPWEEKF